MNRTIWLDIRSALRGLGRYPLATGVAVMSLALGLGGTTALFSLVDAVLLRRLPFQEPERLVNITEKDKEGEGSNTSFATASDLRAMSRSLSGVAVSSYWVPTLTAADDGEAERLDGRRVSANYFRVLGAPLALGRDFQASEDHAATRQVAILGHAFWQRRFGADPAVVGRTITLSGRPYTVVGVLKEGVEYALARDGARDIFSPLGYEATDSWACRTCRHLRAIGRLAPGVGPDEAAVELDRIGKSLAERHPQDYAVGGFIIEPFQSFMVSNSRPWLLTVTFAALALLLLAAVNVGHLELARAIQGRGALAVRTALGARPLDLVRYSMTRALLLSGFGLVLGLVLARAAIPLLVAMAPPGTARLESVALDARVLAAGGALAFLAALLFGSLAAFRSARTAPGDALREGGRGAEGRRHRSLVGGLISTEIALGLALAFGAALLGRSLAHLLDVDPGVASRSVLTAEISIPGSRYGRDPEVASFYARLMRALRDQPGITSVGAVSQLPLGGNVDGWGVEIQGRPVAGPADVPDADRFGMSAGYLETMGIKVVAGRGLAGSDDENAPKVALINEAFARRHFGGKAALGQRIRIGGPEGPWREIVGIVSDVHHGSLDRPVSNQFYLPHPQFPDSGMVVVLRYEGSLPLAVSTLKDTVRALDKDAPVSKTRTMEDVLRTATGSQRFAALLMSGFGGLALILVATGIFSILTFVVTSRQRDYAIRKALGAGVRALTRSVTTTFAPSLLAGLALAVPLCYWTGHRISGLLFQVPPTDAPSVLLAIAALGLSVTLSMASPLWRVLNIEPAKALRDE